MKFWKRFVEDPSSETCVANEYAAMADRTLATINPAELTALGLKCYRAELDRRNALRKREAAQGADPGFVIH
jgi:hypothetical protein